MPLHLNAVTVLSERDWTARFANLAILAGALIVTYWKDVVEPIWMLKV